jgi:spermidine synthase
MQKHIRSRVNSSAGRRIFSEALNPNFGFYYTINKTLYKGKTKYQQLELVDTDEFGKVLLLDNITQVAERNEPHYHEPMVHPAFCCHPDPRNILVIGGGDGGILREVLKYPGVKRVDNAELDEKVITFSKKYLKSVHEGCFNDPRVHVQVIDGRAFTEQHPGQYDIIIMDMTDPYGPSKMLYTREFFRIVKRAFRNDYGIFVMHSESPVTRPKAFSCIQKTLCSVFKNVNPFYLYIQMYAVLWSITLCSDNIDASGIKAEAVDKTLKKSGIDNLEVYSGQTHVSMQVQFPFISKILKRPARIITDAKPDFPDNFIS